MDKIDVAKRIIYTMRHGSLGFEYEYLVIDELKKLGICDKKDDLNKLIKEKKIFIRNFCFEHDKHIDIIFQIGHNDGEREIMLPYHLWQELYNGDMVKLGEIDPLFFKENEECNKYFEEINKFSLEETYLQIMTRNPMSVTQKVTKIAKNIFNDMDMKGGKDKMAIVTNYFIKPGKIFIAATTYTKKTMVGIWKIDMDDDSIEFLGKFNPNETLSKNKPLLKRYGMASFEEKNKTNN